jgi:hypothetical protein
MHDASNLHQNALPETEKRQSKRKEETSSSELKSSSDEKKDSPKPSHEAEKLAALLSGEIRRNAPDFRTTPSQLRKWAVTADRMLRLDSRSYDQIAAVIRWCQADEFWHSNVLSFDKLRDKFDQLLMKAGLQRQQTANGNGNRAEQERDSTIQRASLCKTCSGERMIHQMAHIPGPRLGPCPDCVPVAASRPSELGRNQLPQTPVGSAPT